MIYSLAGCLQDHLDRSAEDPCLSLFPKLTIFKLHYPFECSRSRNITLPQHSLPQLGPQNRKVPSQVWTPRKNLSRIMSEQDFQQGVCIIQSIYPTILSIILCDEIADFSILQCTEHTALRPSFRISISCSLKRILSLERPSHKNPSGISISRPRLAPTLVWPQESIAVVYLLVCRCNINLDGDIWYHYHHISLPANVLYVSGAAISKGSSYGTFPVVKY
jgi:hypothetical protein